MSQCIHPQGVREPLPFRVAGIEFRVALPYLEFSLILRASDSPC
jgi:hypothetical protein